MKLSNSYLCRHKSARLSRRDRLPQAANALGCRSSLGSLAFFRWVHGFELANQVRTLSKQSESEYGARRAAYDLKKLRGKQMVRRIAKT